jgi:isoleucyl-tRNA synthetase
MRRSPFHRSLFAVHRFSRPYRRYASTPKRRSVFPGYRGLCFFAIYPFDVSFHVLLMNYKETLNLPKTEFPMKANLSSREPEILARWDADKIYEQIQEVRKNDPLFILHDGPPFANGDVHMGTALNKLLKDLIVKSRAMAGFRAPYIPGWDCHGLPIEFKVVKESKGLSPLEVRKRSEAYARKYIDIQGVSFGDSASSGIGNIPT